MDNFEGKYVEDHSKGADNSFMWESFHALSIAFFPYASDEEYLIVSAETVSSRSLF